MKNEKIYGVPGIFYMEPKTTTKEQKPYRCPVCNGRGTVPNGFYRSTGDVIVSYTTEPEVCRTCSGKGIVWYDKYK